MKRSVILVHPPQQGLLEGFSSGLIALANFLSLRAADVDVHILDLGLARDDEVPALVSAAVQKSSGDLIVGLTATTATYRSALKVAWDFKQAASECTVVLGGHHAAPEWRTVLKHQRDIDAIATGEGELTLLDLVQRLPDLSAVRGLAYREALGSIVRTPPPAPLSTADLDQLAVEFQGNDISSRLGKFGHVTYVSARGCPLGCHFCSVANQQIRAKSVPQVIEDLRFLVGERGYASVAIEDNFFAHSPKRTLDLCREITRLQKELPRSFRWDCQTRVESMRRPALLEALEKAGCEAVYLGVEALDAKSLQYLGKTPNPSGYLSQLRHEVVPQLLRSGVDCYINLQLGLPCETESSRKEAIAELNGLGTEARKCGRKITVFPMLHVVYPGTRHFAEAVEKNRLGPFGIEAFESFTEWEKSEAPVLRWLGEHFAHGTGGIPEAILDRQALREGRWVVDGNAVLMVQQQLIEMRVQGIEVFDYKDHLTGNQQSAPRNKVIELPRKTSRGGGQ